jgi:hypothetical protein
MKIKNGFRGDKALKEALLRYLRMFLSLNPCIWGWVGSPLAADYPTFSNT